MNQAPGRIDRRNFLTLMAAGAACAAGCTTGGDGGADAAAPKTWRGSGAREDRVLLVVELQGGNDGLSTLVPVTDGAYRDRRPSLALGEDEVVPFADDLALNARLGPLAKRGLAVVAGVGSPSPSMSHFDMMNRWWSGTPASTSRGESGFLGRLAAATSHGEGPAGLAISPLPAPALRAPAGTTVGVPTAERLASEIAGNARAGERLHDAISGFAQLRGGEIDDELGAMLSSSYDGVLELDDTISSLDPAPAELVGPDLAAATFAQQLGFAAQLIAARGSVGVLHMRMGTGDFDTHSRHRDRHAELMEVLGEGLSVFHDVLVQTGDDDRVLVATTSEFGRRVAENDGGLDHGAASCALLMGPVEPGLHGDPPSVNDTDENGNLKSSLAFDRYQATLATWLGVDPSSVLEGEPAPLPRLLAD